MLGGLADLLNPLLHLKQWRFAGVPNYQHDDALKQLAASLDDVEVPVSYRVKAAWIDCDHGVGGGEGVLLLATLL